MSEQRTRTAVSGSFTVEGDAQMGFNFLPPEEHHQGWNRALAAALSKMNWPVGQHYAHIDYSARIDVTNPGSVIEYIVTII
jgi:hypothetical protein